MRKISAFLISIFASFLILFAIIGTPIRAVAENGRFLYVGGMPAGFMLSAGGAQVIGVCDVIGEEKTFSPAKEAGICSGDVIINASGINVETVADLNSIIAKNGANSLELTVKRGNDKEKFIVKPQMDKITKKYKIGVLIRDTVSGIGTITYVDPTTRSFGALGHAVGEECEKIGAEGKLYNCNIVSVLKGTRGKAGELHGIFLGDGEFGKTTTLCECGIFGQINQNVDLSVLNKVEVDSLNAKPGVAYIYSTINGQTPKKYEVEIVKVDKNNKENKNYVVKITDKELIETTGGIVQGMSGSPIVQENKLIGAITHVFLNDPTRGFGIDIEKMLKY
ncbi:MAG: SpoIVB peptidase [Clostridiales bacterium]|nr:SpoIVB peptidase [Clostridiales bacterium]